MPLTPDNYLKNTAKFFPGALVLLVVPDQDGKLAFHIDGMEGAEAMQALETIALAQIALERQSAAVINAVAQMTEQSKDDVLALLGELADKARQEADANAERQMAEMSAAREAERAKREAKQPQLVHGPSDAIAVVRNGGRMRFAKGQG